MKLKKIILIFILSASTVILGQDNPKLDSAKKTLKRLRYEYNNLTMDNFDDAFADSYINQDPIPNSNKKFSDLITPTRDMLNKSFDDIRNATVSLSRTIYFLILIQNLIVNKIKRNEIILQNDEIKIKNLINQSQGQYERLSSILNKLQDFTKNPMQPNFSIQSDFITAIEELKNETETYFRQLANLFFIGTDPGWLAFNSDKKVKDISVSYSPEENEIWAVGINNEIYKLDSKTKNWAQISGSATQVSVGNKDNIWIVNNAGTLYKLESGDWTPKGDNTSYVSAGSDGSVWIIKTDGSVYKLENNNFIQDESAPKFSQISVANKENIWAVTPERYIYNLQNDQWVRIPGKLAQVSASPDGSVWGLTTNDTDHNIVQRFGSNWTKIDGSLIKLAIANNNIVWGISRANTIYITDKNYSK